MIGTPNLLRGAFEPCAGQRHQFWYRFHVPVGAFRLDVPDIGGQRHNSIVDIDALFQPEHEPVADEGVSQIVYSHPRVPTPGPYVFVGGQSGECMTRCGVGYCSPVRMTCEKAFVLVTAGIMVASREISTQRLYCCWVKRDKSAAPKFARPYRELPRAEIGIDKSQRQRLRYP
nr:hypothetical protein [Roseinatronobacter sp. HJB301]